MKLKIDGMSCQHCVMRVQKALQQVAGVTKVQVDLQHGEAEVTLNAEVSPQDLISAIKNAGFESKGV